MFILKQRITCGFLWSWRWMAYKIFSFWTVVKWFCSVSLKIPNFHFVALWNTVNGTTENICKITTYDIDAHFEENPELVQLALVRNHLSELWRSLLFILNYFSPMNHSWENQNNSFCCYGRAKKSLLRLKTLLYSAVWCFNYRQISCQLTDPHEAWKPIFFPVPE